MTPAEPHFLPKASSPNTISLWVGLQHMNLGGSAQPVGPSSPGGRSPEQTDSPGQGLAVCVPTHLPT